MPLTSYPHALFPGTDRPRQPMHDVRLSPTSVAALGCGAFGQVVLRLVNDAEALVFPARAVPCRAVQEGHVLMAEAAMAAWGGKMGSAVDVQPVADVDDAMLPVTLHLVPLSTADSLPPPQPVLQRAARAIGGGAWALGGSLLMVRFLAVPVAYRVLKVERHTNDDSQTDVVLVSAERGAQQANEAEEGEEATPAFAASVLDEILEVVAQGRTGRRGVLGMQGLLFSGMRGAGKTFFLQQLRRRLGVETAVHVRGKDLLEPLVNGDDARVAHLLSSSDGAPAAVVLLDDFDHLVLGGEEEEGGANMQEEEHEPPGGRAATRALKALQRHLTGPGKPHRPVCWVLATRESVSGVGSASGGRASWHRLTCLQGALYDKVLEMPVPSPTDRVSILRHVLRDPQQGKGARVEETMLKRVGDMTGGFLPGDLVTLCQVAAFKALAASEGGNGEDEERELPWMEAFVAARKEVSPAALSGVGDRQQQHAASSSSKLSWSSIGGYEDVKARLRKLVEWPTRYAETFARLGLRPPRRDDSAVAASSLPGGGILLHGPSGCGKSLFARVLAAEVGANFVELPASEVFSPFLGDSEARVRRAFARARQAAPCILFLDELDTMAAGRDSSSAGGEGGAGGVYARVLSTLLNEMDGVSGQSQGLLVLAATNRREAVDAALLRPGRLQESLYIGYPRPEADYLSILHVATRHMALGPDVDLGGLAAEVLAPLVATQEGSSSAARITPANLLAVCREAGLACLRETNGMAEEEEDVLVVRQAHFLRAVEASLNY